jgi:peroxiredoxin
MKNIFALLIISGILISCTNISKKDFNFSINGTIEGDYAGQTYLKKREAGEWILLDSSMVENKSFRFEGTIDYPEVYYLSIENEQSYASVFAEQSDIAVKINLEDFSNPEITGSKTQADYEDYLAKNDVYEEKLSDIWTRMKAMRDEGNVEQEAMLEEEFDKTDEEKKAFILQNAKDNNTSVAAAYAVLRNAYYYDETDLEPVVNSFDASILESVYVKSLTERVETMQRVAVGQPAVDFTMADMEGNPIALSSLYGKYLLVDFWASWCGPCRRENPNVVNAYNAYHEKGFDILGVSFDKDNQKWLDAVAADNLTWHHVSDLKGWGNAAGKLYAVNSIPANILLDPEGNIIAKNLREEDLHNKLKELLGE